VLFVDVFDLVARDKQFPQEFFDQLRGAADTLPLTYVIASAAPLNEIAHAGALSSPFFNLFYPGTWLPPLTPVEVDNLIGRPPGGPGLDEVGSELRQLAGSHPALLQFACQTAWDLRAQWGRIDPDHLREVFLAGARKHYQHIWDYCTLDERI